MARPLSCLEGWLIAKRIQNCSPKTLYKNEHTVKRFIASLDPLISTLADVTTADVRRYLAARTEVLSPSSLDTDRRVLSAFFNFCVQEELIEETPMKRIQAIHVPKKVIPTLPQHIIGKLLAQCDDSRFIGTRDKAIILTFLDTGIRRAELVAMSRRDLYKEAVVIHGKGSKERFIRISPRTQKAIWRYMLFRRDNLDALWLTEERRPLQSGGVRQIIRRLASRAGIKDYHVSAHIFRHTYATEMLRLGVDERSLQAFLGHSTSAMTRRYTEQFNSLDALRLHQVSPVEAMEL